VLDGLARALARRGVLAQQEPVPLRAGS